MVDKIRKASHERGALMLEAIALLGLMTMMSPMVVRQTADRSAEMEEVAVAGQMKTLRDAVSAYIDANYANIAGWTNDSKVLTTADIRPYLPPAFIQTDGSIGNRLVDNYKIGVRRERPCTDLSKDECNRYKIIGLIASGLNTEQGGNLVDKSDELDDRRAARIATMIGADGGYIRSSKSIESLFGGADAEVEAKKAIGAQGVWEIDDVNKFFPDGGWKPGRGRVVATTMYSSGISGDFLYRRAVNGLAEANSMFTNIDMSGLGTGNHQIRGAGGLEVINGRLVVKSATGITDDAAETQVSATEVTTKGSMRADSGAEFYHSSGVVNSGLKVRDGVEATVGSTKLDMGSTSIEIQGANSLKMDANEVEASGDNVKLTATADVNVGAANFDVNASKEIYMRASDTAEIDAKEAFITASSRAQMTAGSNGIATASNKPYASQGTRVIGGLNVVQTFNMTDSGDRVRLLASMGTSESNLYMGNIATATATTSSAHQFRLTTGTGGGAIRMGRTGTPSNVYIGRDTSITGTNYSGAVTLADNSNRRTIKTTAGTGTGGAVTVTHGYITANTDPTTTDRTAGMDGRFGQVTGAIFEPRRIAITASPSTSAHYGNPVRNQNRIQYDDWGVTSSRNVTISTGSRDLASFGQIVSDYSGLAYNSYSGDANYRRYRVDPAFISVMNDIILTSRGGARISEMSPNYINKGIYVLSNSYGRGGWPCSGDNCQFVIPRLAKPGGGAVVSGGWEHDCDTMKPYLVNSSMCSNSGSRGIYINYQATSYQDCGNSACLSHPFMGFVPAPGRQVVGTSHGGTAADTMAAYDEGRCPDGYVPVMTLTPTTFDVGKVNFIDLNVLVDVNDVEGAAYNLEYQNFGTARPSIYQPATMVQVAAEMLSDRTGWRIAMGTVTYANNTNGYIWNMGGIFNGRMEAIAHTYCYFNPTRFSLPNMGTDATGTLRTLDNPAITSIRN